MKESSPIQRIMTGTVISNKMRDTISVLIERSVKHPKYGKYVRRSTKLHAHDPGNQCQMGDVVSIVSCAPISKMKHWKLVEIKTKAE